MTDPMYEINALSDMLAAEAAGHPFDRGQAYRLATKLAEENPGIRKSMAMLCERLQKDVNLASAA